MVSQMKIKMSTLAEFCGLFLFWRRFALDNSKNGKCPLSLVLIGDFVDKTQQSLRLVFRFVIRYQTSGQFQSNIICQRGLVHSISALSTPFLLKSMKKQHKFVENLSTTNGKFQDEPRRQVEIERGYLSRGLPAQSDLATAEDYNGLHKKLIEFVFCWFVRKSLEKHSKGEKTRGKES